jgi:signal transduction histidine kinase
VVLVAATAAIAVITTDSVGPLISGSGAVVVISAVALTVWAPRPKLLFAAVPGSAAVSLLVTFTYQGPARSAAANWWTAETLALMILVIVGIRRPKAWTAAVLAVLLAATITLSPLRIALNVVPPSSSSETLQLCLIWAILAIVAIGIGSYLRGLDARGRAALVAERRAERMSLARDLHDYAAHDVTAVVVLVEAAQVLAKEDPQRALELLSEIGEAGAQALKAMDHTVQLLAESPAVEERNRGLDAVPRPDPAAGEVPRQSGAPRRDLTELTSLVERFNRTGSPKAVLDVAEDGLEGIPGDVSRMGYRVIVEALTNVRRHAATASRVVIRIRRETPAGRSVLRLTVTDDASHPRPGLALERLSGAGGTGISSLSERAEELGGELRAGAWQPGGWQVALVLPVDDTRDSRPINLPNG